MLKFSMICYITESKHNNEQEVSQMLEVDDKAMRLSLQGDISTTLHIRTSFR